MCKYTDSEDIGYHRTSDHIIALVDATANTQRLDKQKYCPSAASGLCCVSIGDFLGWFRARRSDLRELQNLKKRSSRRKVRARDLSEYLYISNSEIGIFDSLRFPTIDQRYDEIAEAPRIFHDSGSPLQKFAIGLLRSILL